MYTILGFLFWALAEGGPAALNSAATAANVRLIVPFHFIDSSPFHNSTTIKNCARLAAGGFGYFLPIHATTCLLTYSSETVLPIIQAHPYRVTQKSTSSIL
jgi:hypothetical protein